MSALSEMILVVPIRLPTCSQYSLPSGKCRHSYRGVSFCKVGCTRCDVSAFLEYTNFKVAVLKVRMDS
jgi:hypothetical protein